MLRMILNIAGMISLVMAVITAVLDLTRSIANSALTTTALGLEWSEFHVASLQYLQVGIERHLGLPWLWSAIFCQTPKAFSTRIEAIDNAYPRPSKSVDARVDTG